MSYQDITEGNAVVCGSEQGWHLPGGKVTKSEAKARMMALRMARMMRKLEEVK